MNKNLVLLYALKIEKENTTGFVPQKISFQMQDTSWGQYGEMQAGARQVASCGQADNGRFTPFTPLPVVLVLHICIMVSTVCKTSLQ